MKKGIYLFALICVTILLLSCEDNDDTLPSPAELSVNYTNKLSAPAKSNTLILNYSGQACIGKTVSFKTSDNRTATLTLTGIFPNETNTVIPGISLVQENDKYRFSGTSTNSHGTTYRYEGYVGKGELKLDLKDIQLVNNPITGKWEPTPFDYISQTTIPFYSLLNKQDDFIGGFIVPVIGSMYIEFGLQNITFGKDGNLIASYHDVSDVDPMGNSIPERPDDSWQTSPSNLVFYSVSDSIVYIKPNIDMIIHQIRSNQTDTKSEEDNSLDLMTLLKIYTQVNKWATKGIPLVIREGSNKFHKPELEDEIKLVLKKEELKVFIPLLPYVKKLIPEEILNGAYGSIIEQLLDPFLEDLTKPDAQMEIGINLVHRTEI